MKKGAKHTFPGLKAFCVTSARTEYYNCIAWAAKDGSRWWEPGRKGAGYYWPPKAYVGNDVATLLSAFVDMNYRFSKKQDGSLEDGIEKLALWICRANDDWHAARQLESGARTSKLGVSFDIEHRNLASVEALYGTPVAFLARRRDGGLIL